MINERLIMYAIVTFILALCFYVISKVLNKIRGRRRGVKPLNIIKNLFNNSKQGMVIEQPLQENLIHSFDNSYRPIEKIIPEEKTNKERVKYFEKLLEKNDALVVKTSIDYLLVTKSPKGLKDQYQATSYTDKQLTRLADDSQYANLHEMAKHLSLGDKEVIDKFRAEMVLESKPIKEFINEFIDNEMDKSCHLDSINDYKSPKEFYLSNITGEGKQMFIDYLKNDYNFSGEEATKIYSEVIKGIEKKCTEIQPYENMKSKIIDMYSKEFPAIKNISEKTASIINNLNNSEGQIWSIKDIKELHNNLGKKLEQSSNSGELKEFKNINEVVNDLKQANLSFKQEQAHEKVMTNQLTKANTLEL